MLPLKLPAAVASGLCDGIPSRSCWLQNSFAVQKHVQLDLSRWVGHAIDDGPSIDQALAELRGREVPWKALKPVRN